MEKETDGIGEPKATWTFCGAFPLEEIKNGRRACRHGWRNRGSEFDMLSVVRYTNQGEPSLGLQREAEEYIDGSLDEFNFIDDLQATDWFLEDKIGQETVSQPTEPLVEAPNWLWEELGYLEEARLAKVIAVLLTFMTEIRQLNKRGENRLSQCAAVVGTNCNTCAFNPATDNLQGFGATAYGLMRSLRLTAPFLCHRGQSTNEKATNMVRKEALEKCVGFATVFITQPQEAHAAAMRATEAIRAIVPDATMKMPSE